MRLLFDLSSLVRWRGPTVGMIRAQQQLARYARVHRTDAVFTVFDAAHSRPRAIRPEWIDAVIENEASIEPSLVFTPGMRDHRILRRMPRVFGEVFFWATKFRRKRLSQAERRLLESPGRKNPRAEKIIRRMMKPGERTFYLNADGSLRPCPPLDMILDDTLELAADDILVSAQSDWFHIDIDAVAADQRRRGLRHVVLCYDIIPILFPETYADHDVRHFRSYYGRAFASADRVIFNAQVTERDARSYCRSLGFDLADTRIVPLGSDIRAEAGADSVPAGLEPGRFVLYVSTVEPRKNHRMLVDVWRRLVSEGQIGVTGFKLVFVGRSGWKMEDFFADLAADPEYGRSILHLTDLPDPAIAALYAKAAFSVYPSVYEGYGLPPTESMLAGTPVIASTGGSLPEVIGDSGLCLDPADPDLWHREMGRMIADEAYRRSWAERARAYRHVSWHEAGEMFFAAVAEPFAPRRTS
jgi:glycosyltransferase involved in cell wall biosynthesis